MDFVVVVDVHSRHKIIISLILICFAQSYFYHQTLLWVLLNIVAFILNEFVEYVLIWFIKRRILFWTWPWFDFCYLRNSYHENVNPNSKVFAFCFLSKARSQVKKEKNERTTSITFTFQTFFSFSGLTC